MSLPDSSGVTESIAHLSITTRADAPHDPVEETEEQTTPRQDQFPPDSQPLERPDEDAKSDSGTERETTAPTATKMPSGSSSSRHHSSSSSAKKHGSSSSKHHPKSDDWSDVTEPEERRRIQNRIAQRKFREKAREQKERQERETRNQELAGSSYAVPLASDLGYDDQLSGLPWGGLNIPHMVARGHESASQQGASDHQQHQQHQQQQQYGGGGGSFYDAQLWAGDDGALGPGGYGGAGGFGDAGDDRYFDTSASSSSPSYFSYDAFPGDAGSSSGTMQ